MAVPRVPRHRLSPTARLLRNSRLFSLPNPLPRPVVGETTGAGVTKASDSATLPYPTHQAITTTKSSLARGDWGLKRNLPARSHLLQTSDPVLRIAQLDTIEHVTDFDSAADHVRTRQKWEHMGVPMMRSAFSSDVTSAPPPSAFERRDDTTSYRKAGLDESGLFLRALKQNKRAREYRQWKSGGREQPFSPFQPPPVSGDVHNARRWKHDGPWLPGMSADEFLAYVGREIGKRRAEFHDHLVEFVKNEIYTTRQLAAARAGDLPPIDQAEAQAWQAAREREWSAMTQRDIDAGIRALRKETASDPLRSRLVTKLITPFLHLPTIHLKEKMYQDARAGHDFQKYTVDPERAPISTHPSAGLGYLKTRAYLATHPILGPQGSAPPVVSRVLQPRLTAFNKESYARLGVGGFVANDQHRGQDGNARPGAYQNIRDVETIDIATPGGKKILVNPQFAAVSNDGRIHLRVLRSTGPEVAVARGQLDDLPPPRDALDPDLPLDIRPRPGPAFTSFAKKGLKSGVAALDQLAPHELSETSAQGRRFADLLAQPSPAPRAADALRSE